jgi:hypothetical protein
MEGNMEKHRFFQASVLHSEGNVDIILANSSFTPRVFKTYFSSIPQELRVDIGYQPPLVRADSWGLRRCYGLIVHVLVPARFP